MTRTVAIAALIVLIAGCENAAHDMYDQPKMEVFESSTLFGDGRVQQPPVAGSVARSAGARADASSGRLGTMVAAAAGTPGARAGSAAPWGENMPEAALPEVPSLRLDRATLARGRDRYEIHCTPCHSPLGDGRGTVVRRGFPAPPSFHSERLRSAPDGHFYAVISEGYGAMFPYGDRLTPEDRAAVIAWIRTLQLSQHFDVQRLDDAERARLAGGGA